jgi:hypothetical protein
MASSFVGASLLAKVVNGNAESQTPLGGLRFIASRLAHTVDFRDGDISINTKPQNDRTIRPSVSIAFSAASSHGLP